MDNELKRLFRLLRAKKGQNQKDMAAVLKIRGSYLSHVENGNANISTAVMKKLNANYKLTSNEIAIISRHMREPKSDIARLKKEYNKLESAFHLAVIYAENLESGKAQIISRDKSLEQYFIDKAERAQWQKS